MSRYLLYRKLMSRSNVSACPITRDIYQAFQSNFSDCAVEAFPYGGSRDYNRLGS